MRWPWQKPERREAIGGYTDIIGRLIEAQASGATANASATAAVEAASGALSRALTAAQVDGPDWVSEAVTPRVLGQIGRDLIRVGESLHVIRYMGGRLRLIPASTWYWEGDVDLHRDGLWPIRFFDMARAAGVCDFLFMGQSDRKALSRDRADRMGSGNGPPECRNGKIPGG